MHDGAISLLLNALFCLSCVPSRVAFTLHDGVQRELSFSNRFQRAKAVSDNRARLPDDSVKLYFGLFHAAD